MQNLIYPVVLVALCVLCLCGAETHNITQPKCGGKEKASTLLDVARDFMNKAKKLYPECIDDDLNCGKKEKSLAFLEVASNLIIEAKKSFPTCHETECPNCECPEPECPERECPESECPEPECPEPEKEPMDCSEILQSGKNESGIYTIWPKTSVPSNQSLTVYCDMDTDGGGWTVIQRRGNFSTPKDYFFRDWKSYKAGFGNIKEEFWLGNDNIHSISNQGNYTIRFDLKDAAGVTGYAYYDTFRIEDERYGYKLHIHSYTGDVGDATAYNNNGMKFTTKDRDNDMWSGGNCAKDQQGAWWYNVCGSGNMNGLNRPGIYSVQVMHWNTWRDIYGLSEVEIKLRPRKM